MLHYMARARGEPGYSGESMSRHNINYFDESTERSEGSRTSSTPFLSFPSPVFPMVSTIVTGGRHPQRRKLFRNVFRRQSQESMLGSSAALPSFDQPPQDDEKIDNVSMAPSPHTHPLLARPVARSEAIQGHLQVAIAKGITPRASDAQFAAARRDAERVRGATTDPSPVRLRLDSEETHGRPATARDVYTRTLREREMTALNAAAETRYIREWGFFLKCYAEGRYNISTPPDPPPRRADFIYLPAPAPLNEGLRLEAVEYTDVDIFPRWAAEQQKKYVLLAKFTFNTPFAAISYVNHTHELLRCEVGYRPDYVLGYIPRKRSLAAHALLSSEPMVILDTSKDWRTKGNPLVKGHPKIRFYAAAPLITKAGHFLGAFAIFDDKPKIEFGIVARRQLSEFAKRVTSDLEQAAMQYYETQARAVELRMDLIENFRVQSSNRADRASEDCKVPELPARSPSRTFMRHRRTRADYVKRLSSAQLIVAENTPPESDYGSDRTLERNKTTPEMERSHSRKQSSTGSKNTFKSARESVVISDPYTPPQSPPRPYLDMTIGSPETPREPRRPPNTPVKDAQRTSMASASSLQTILRIDDDLLPAPLRSASSSTTSKEKLDQLPHTPGPHNAVAEASFAAALVAGSLGYDFLYLLRFSPVDGGTVDKGLTEGGMYNTEVLISHGMPHPIPYFDPALHLRALHASRGLVYQNPNSVAAGGTFEYEFGLLFPVVHSDTERKSPEHSPLMVDGGIESDPDSKNTHPAFRDRHHDHTPKIIEYDTHSNFNETSTTSLNTTVCRSGVILAGFMRKAPVDGKVSSENISEMTKLGKRLKELLLDDR